MNYEQLKNMLEDYNEKKVQIDIMKEELQSIEVTGQSAINYETSNSQIIPIEEIEQYKIDLQKKVFIEEKKLAIIDKAMEVLSKIQNDVINRKVIEDEPYYKVCGDLGISERYARKIKKMAILKMVEVINMEQLH